MSLLRDHRCRRRPPRHLEPSRRAQRAQRRAVGRHPGRPRRGAGRPELRCVVLTGTGRAFTAGQDLGEMMAPPDHGDDELHGYRGLIPVLEEFDKPLLAAVNGVGRRHRRHAAPLLRHRVDRRGRPAQGAVRDARRHHRGRRQPAPPAADGLAGGRPLHLHGRRGCRPRRRWPAAWPGRSAPRDDAARRDDGRRPPDRRHAGRLAADHQAPHGGRPPRRRAGPPAQREDAEFVRMVGSPRTPKPSPGSSASGRRPTCAARRSDTASPAAAARGPGEVGLEVVGVLEADRHADQAVGDAELGPLRRACSGRRSWPGGSAASRGRRATARSGPARQRSTNAMAPARAAGHLEGRPPCRPLRHLARGQLVLRVARQARVATPTRWPAWPSRNAGQLRAPLADCWRTRTGSVRMPRMAVPRVERRGLGAHAPTAKPRSSR